MNRRDLLAASAGLTLSGFPICLASSPQVSGKGELASGRGINRHAVLVRSGFTREPDGTDERAPSPSGMFDTEVVRSADSEGCLAVFVFPSGEHHPNRGAPLHVHHEQDEWIYIMTGEFVAEVGGRAHASEACRFLAHADEGPAPLDGRLLHEAKIRRIRKRAERSSNDMA